MLPLLAATTAMSAMSAPVGAAAMSSAPSWLPYIGAGLGIFGGLRGGGGKPKPQIRSLSPQGKQLKDTTFAAIKDLAPPSALTSDIMGKVLRVGQARQRTARQSFGYQGTQPVRTGAGLRGLIGEIGQRYQETATPAMAVGNLRKNYASRRLGYMSKFMGLERRVPIQLAQRSLISQLNKQAQGARYGAALGNAAEFGAIMKYFNS